MTPSLPDRNWALGQITNVERLGRKSQEHIADRVRLGTPFLVSVQIKSNHTAEIRMHLRRQGADPSHPDYKYDGSL